VLQHDGLASRKSGQIRLKILHAVHAPYAIAAQTQVGFGDHRKEETCCIHGLLDFGRRH
jgi:hypothetical protein